MRFKSYLNEFVEFDEEKIAKDCAFFLSQMEGSNIDRFMYRGINSENVKVDVVNKFVPRDKSMDSSKRFHDKLNEVLEKKFGHPFRNGLFVTGDQNSAAEYADEGGVYIVVPVGKFEWLTNPHFFDLYNHMLHIQNEQDWTYREAEDEVVEQVELSNDWIHNKNLAQCIRKGNEIMLWCPNGYYLFDYDDYPEVLDGK